MILAEKTRKFIWLLPFLLIFLSCGKDVHVERAEKDRQKILDYLEENELDAVELESGVFIVKEEEGTGSYPSEGSSFSLFYVGSLLDGTVFAPPRHVQNMELGMAVRGFAYGVMEFRRGGKGMILVPSGLGYGERGTYTIPRNAVLIFEVEIFDFH